MFDFSVYRADTAGKPGNTVYPIREVIMTEEGLARAASYDHVCAKYRDNKRSEANFISSDVVAMDCDNDHSDIPAEWKTPEDVRKAFPEAAFCAVFSKSNMKEKNGRAARPKFHVYFPIETVEDAKEYAALKRRILARFRWFDDNAVDAARFFFGNPGNGARFYEGKRLVDELIRDEVSRSNSAYIPKQTVCNIPPEVWDNEQTNTIPEGRRNSHLSSFAGRAIKRWGNTADVYKLFLQEAEKCVPPLPENELNAIWNSAERYARREAAKPGYIPPSEYNKQGPVMNFLKRVRPEMNPRYIRTDIGSARLFADCFKDRCRFVPERKSWFIYGNGLWERDIKGLSAMQLLKELAVELTRYAPKIENADLREDYIKFCAHWHTRRTRETILSDAEGIYPIHIEEFDRDPFVLNVKNGTLHLDTGEFTGHSPEDLLTRMADAEYRPGLENGRFLAFIDEIMQGDGDKAGYLRKAFGYALSGDTRYECMFILYGATTRNGKGTLCESVLNVLGTYACTTRPETIGVKPVNSQNASEDLARLAGIRFSNISEPGKGLRLNAALVKSMTGSDTVNARFLHENSFDFRPQFKLFINTNYLPSVTDVTLFRSGRIRIIPFERHFSEAEQDKELKNVFRTEEAKSAILNWLLEGFRALLAEGFDTPESVRYATDEYMNESDRVARFMEEELKPDLAGEMRMKDVYDRYRRWCEANGFFSENSRNFHQELKRTANVVRKRIKGTDNKAAFLIGYSAV